MIYDIPNSNDDESGVIDVLSVRDALDNAGKTQAQVIFALFYEARVMQRTIYIIEAAAGWNRGGVEQGLEKHSQIDIKAYGALPLQNEDEILQRYLVLLELEKVATKFGAQRRATHTGSVQAAISNLAQLAGYSDVMQYKWDMETQISGATDSNRNIWQFEDYHIEAVIDNLKVKLIVEKNGKTLKSIPKAVRQIAFYGDAKEAVAQLRRQVSRVRKGLLERLIASGETITLANLERILKLPAAHSLMQSLIYHYGAGFFGILNAETMMLEGLNNQQQSIDSPVIVAYPYHSVLSDWQRE